jgi:hypothetical protein
MFGLCLFRLAMTSLEKIVSTVSILMQGLTLAMKAPVALIRGFKKSEIQGSADAIVSLARAFEFLGLSLPVVEDADTLAELLKPDKAKEQLDTLNQQVRDAMKKVSNTFERESKLINKKQAALFSLETARLLDVTSRALVEEGGPFGTFTRKIAEIGAKNGAAFGEALQNAAFAVFEQEGDLKQIFLKLADARQKAVAERGPTLGITTTQLAGALKTAEEFGLQIAGRVGEIFNSQREFTITALAGLDAPDKARQIITKNFKKAFGDDLLSRLFEAGEADIFGLSEKETKEILAEFIRRVVEMRRFARDTLQNFKAVDTVVRSLRTSMRGFDSTAIEGLVKLIEKTKLEESAEKAKLLGSEWVKIGNQARSLAESGRRVSQILGDQFVAAVNKFIAAKDKVGLINFILQMKQLTVTAKENGKKVNELADENYKRLINVLKEFGLVAGDIIPAAMKKMRDGIIESAKFTIAADKAWKDWEKELKKFPSTWLTIQRLLADGPLKPEDIDMQTAKFQSEWEKALDRTAAIHRARAGLVQKIWNNRLANMGNRQREMVKTVVASTKSLMAGLSSSLASSSSKISDVFKRFIDTIKAKLIELTVVKPLLKGILSPVLGIFGGAGKSIISQVFGGGLGAFGAGGRGSAIPGSPFGNVGAGLVSPTERLAQFGGGGPPLPRQLAGGTSLMGSDRIPALLAPGEIVFDTDASDLIRQGAMGGGMGGAMHVTINAMDGADVKRVFENQIVPMMKGQLKNNQGISSDVAIRSNRSVRARRFR